MQSAGKDVPNCVSRTQPSSMLMGHMRCWKSWIGQQDKPSRHLVLNGSSRGVPKQWIHRWLQRCQNCLRECLDESYSTQIAYLAKNVVQGLPYVVRNLLQLPMHSREKNNCFPEVKESLLLIACWTSAVKIFGEIAHCWTGHSGQAKVLNLQSFRSVLYPIRGQCRFLL